MTTQVSNGNGAATTAPAPTFAEAPASATLRTISPTGYDIMWTVRADSVKALTERVTFLADWLGKQGYTPTPTRAAAPATTAPNGQGNGQGAEAAPICPTHGKAMKQGRHGWFCPVKLLDDDGTGRPVYCKQTVK